MTVPSDSAVVKARNDFLTSDTKGASDQESLHFCGQDCLVQYTQIRQQSSEQSKVID